MKQRPRPNEWRYIWTRPVEMQQLTQALNQHVHREPKQHRASKNSERHAAP
jgi:hypothetical protein